MHNQSIVVLVRRVARNSQWRAVLGIWGEDPSRRRHKGLGAEPPALKNFAFFCKNNLILEVF